MMKKSAKQEYLQQLLKKNNMQQYNNKLLTFWENHKLKTNNKILPALKDAVIAAGLKTGMTISFHHHYRHGDRTVEQVLAAIKELGIKNLTISASSFTRAHDCLVDYIKDGVVSSLEGSALRGKLGDSISEGLLKKPVIIRSHGGRARAIKTKESKIDVAFLAVASSDNMGNANGVVGKSICGSLGYALVDVKYANKVVLITDTIVNYPNEPISIEQTLVDYVVQVENIADISQIASGEIHAVFSPKELMIAENIVKVVTNTKNFKTGFSYQTGTGGASQASLVMLKQAMMSKNIKAGFFLGGIIAQHVNLLENGLVEKLLDVQSFDFAAAESLLRNKNHSEISADFYANPDNKGCAVNKLDYGILSALEVDVDFNVNVLTGADGYIRGASGGHCDVAFGSDIAIVAVPLLRGRIPSITNKVQTIVTPGNTVDVIVTETGICVNPKRTDIIAQLHAAKVKLKTIEELRNDAYDIIGSPQQIDYDYSHPVALVEYRDGSNIDIIYHVKPFSWENNAR